MTERNLALLLSLLPLLGQGCLSGCTTLNPQPPVEAFANKLVDEAIVPAVRSGLAQGVEQMAIQAGAQGINPAYVVKFEGKWVVGVEGQASVGVEGIAGQLQVASTAGEEAERSPYAQPVPAEASAATGDRRSLAPAPSEAQP
ncbi:MAG: hypothetical protein GY842_27540 [bacterium]|nr:hypothetical protein [bacterium]